MTQRFGGVFSILNQRDYTDLVRIQDLELDTTEFDTKDFSSMTKIQIINAIKDMEYSTKQNVSQWREDLREEDSSDPEYLEGVTLSSSNLARLGSIRKKLEGKS